MKREIKFRAWDKENKEMLLFSNPTITRPTSGGYGDTPKKDFWERDKEGKRNARFEMDFECDLVTGYNHDDFNDTYDCELMQFTGLLDKNGKEIYEGDIVDFKSNGCCVKEGYKEQVIFNEIGYIPFCRANSVGELEYDSKNCKVISNIYQNPNLLN